jgi:hypothetical protein
MRSPALSRRTTYRRSAYRRSAYRRSAYRRSAYRRSAQRLVAFAALWLATHFDVEVRSEPSSDVGPVEIPSAEMILSNQPKELVDRLFEENVVVLQEVRPEGGLRGGIISAYVIFDEPPGDVFELLAQSTRQTEFRPELTSIETIEMGPNGPIDEHRLKILFRRYEFRLQYRVHPQQRHIDWVLDERFDNDLAYVSGSWDLYEMSDGRTLGRSGTQIDVGPAVPAFLQDWITRKNLPQTMERVRLWVESEGIYRP